MTKSNGKDHLNEYVVTVMVERHTTIRARTPEAARERVEQQQRLMYGSGSNVTVTSVSAL